MPLNLNDLMKKAKEKGITSPKDKLLSPSLLLRPWQQESVLFDSDLLASQKPTTNRQQTDSKQRTNRQQTDNKTDNKPITKKHQPQKAITKRQQTDSATDNTTDNKATTNRQQSDNKQATRNTFSSLVGLQRAIVVFIYNECRKSRAKSTEALTLEHISKTLGTSSGCVKTTIQRLESKELIKRLEYKNGRGGWSKYFIPDCLFQELLQHETENKATTNWQQTGNKLATQPTTEVTTKTSSSSGINNYLNTTTTSEEKNGVFIGLDEEWSKIDFESLANIGFTETHLKQIASQGLLKSDMVQDSIHAFAFDLENNGKGKSIRQPLNYFMGILRKGQPYAPPDNYESPKDRLMRLYAGKMKKIAKEREAVQKEAEELAFSEWFYKLTDEEVKKLLPGNINITVDRAIKDSPMARGVARNYFKENVWADLKETIENSEE